MISSIGAPIKPWTSAISFESRFYALANEVSVRVSLSSFSDDATLFINHRLHNYPLNSYYPDDPAIILLTGLFAPDIATVTRSRSLRLREGLTSSRSSFVPPRRAQEGPPFGSIAASCGVSPRILSQDRPAAAEICIERNRLEVRDQGCVSRQSSTYSNPANQVFRCKGAWYIIASHVYKNPSRRA